MRYLSTRSLVIICVLFIAAGCNPRTISLKGSYSDKPFEITTTEPIDSVWADLKDIFTKNSLPIKEIDKSRGLIRLKNIRMNSIYTFEDNNGQLEQPQAWVVMPRDFIKEKEWKPKTIHSQWSVQVTEAEKGNTTIKIDPLVICTYYPNNFTKVETRGQSTGKLERILEGYLNHD